MRILTIGMVAAAAAAAACGQPMAASIEASNLRQLLTLNRIYVDRLTGGDTAAQMRDILISSLASSRMFVLTEKEERADAVLRGAAEDLVFTETHQSSDSINAHMNLSAIAPARKIRPKRQRQRGRPRDWRQRIRALRRAAA